jgi:flagellar biosynthesis/type III secretory pathway protein FliH
VDEYRQEGIKLGIEQGIEQGIEKGQRKEAVSITLRQLRTRFGPLDPVLEQSVHALPLELLEDLGVALLSFNSATDLDGWLKQHQQ